MHLFGRKPKTDPRDAIIKLRNTIDMLDKREQHLNARALAEHRTALSNAATNKRVALAALKRKKLYELEIGKISDQKLTLENQVMAIESAAVNQETSNAIKAGAEAMETIHKQVDITKVEKTMDKVRDQMDIANEISTAITRPVGLGAMDIDEDELAAELDQLEEQNLDEQLAGIQKVPLASTPAAAATVAAPALTPEQLKQLQAQQYAELETQLQLEDAALAVPTNPQRQQAISSSTVNPVATAEDGPEDESDLAELRALMHTN